MQWESNGYKCIVFEGLGWCGYVGVPKEHPFFGLDYSDVDSKIDTCELTFSCGYNPDTLVTDSDFWFFGLGCFGEGNTKEAVLADTRCLCDELKAIQKKEVTTNSQIFREEIL